MIALSECAIIFSFLNTNDTLEVAVYGWKVNKYMRLEENLNRVRLRFTPFKDHSELFGFYHLQSTSISNKAS